MGQRTEVIPADDIAGFIHSLRNQRIILDSDLAEIYGVSVKRLNEQFRRNRERFPNDFAFQLTQEEWEALRSQIATLNRGRGQHRKYPPYAFTEHGALMVANILNSPRAVSMSVYVIRAFIRIREDLVANAAILKRLAEIDKTLLIHDVTLREILQKLRPLLEPPTEPPRPEIGFHVKEDAVLYRIRKKTRKRSGTQ
jgi:phage regulator Rha-like protein